MEYFSDEAYKLCVWSYEKLSSDRPRAIRIKRAAYAVEERYREGNKDIIQKICQRQRLGGSHTYPKKESWAKQEAMREENANESTACTI
ncbi:hypothetical protein PQ478_09265 [Alkalihalophilus pseudofirmus]|uniref:hypothetical protein n=1 Tax=Alkalihalophilus pseudofirmus TaxID=79885 RepID=UPI00259B4208|nr:hypothetical protein [Alkalihalophilus pseudofirmus]WEG18658.1 hypothetical protein PQ478_09265 [Alkalihalophilus pseudofirmus]